MKKRILGPGETQSTSAWPTFAGDPAKRKRGGKRKGLGKKATKGLSHQKKSARGSDLGRRMEERIEAVGHALVESGELAGFVRHEPNSSEDCTGKDFTATVLVDDTFIDESFGITISGEKKRIEAQARYPRIPQWWTPWNMRDETLRTKILALFNK